jgi:hypothetical protein
MNATLLRSSIAGLRTPPQLVAGLVLISTWWVIAWNDFGRLSDFYFFPLWLGYILTVDGLVLARTGTSPLTRSAWHYVVLFVISAPFWWSFEAINEALHNWNYLVPPTYGWFGRWVLGSLSFATVIPAVLTTAELVASFGRRHWRRALVIDPGRRGLIAIHLAGWAMLAAMLVWPEYLFPLCWISVFLILDPLARFLGRTTVSSYAARGDWRPIFNLAAAGLVCGWFWEMWNIYSMPKWVYTVPHVDFLKVWEMPVLGYGGYVPFAFEILAYYALVTALLPWFDQANVRITRGGQIDRDDDGYI